MEDFIGIIVLVLIALVSASGKKKKKAEKPVRQRRQAEKPRETGFEQAFARKQAEALKQQAERQAPGKAEHEADCDRRPLHLHEVTPRQMEAAGEGEDPCHAGYHAPEEPSPIYAPEAAQADFRAQELLRGVIMSEILKRPCERMAERHDRRRA